MLTERGDHHEAADELGERNCQPIRTQRTSPSSHTRLVEANWKESEAIAEAPLAKSERAIAIAA